MTETISMKQISKAARMYSRGVKVKEIAEEIGVSHRRARSMIEAHRDRFPPRKQRRFTRYSPAVQIVAETNDAPAGKVSRDDRVVRRTLAGALVTMPRVTMIDGRAE